MVCDSCKKKNSLYFKHVAGICICEVCFAKKNQNWFREERWKDFNIMFDWDNASEEYEYYLDILDLIPNRNIVDEQILIWVK
jgi:predicted RNA-binding protein associated with RNAse of E/G family